YCAIVVSPEGQPFAQSGSLSNHRANRSPGPNGLTSSSSLMHAEVANEALSLNSVTLLIVIALACGFAMVRLKQPAIVGYIFAGVVLGPYGLGLIKSAEGIDFFAELGLLLLLFIVGIELSLQSFKQIYKIALFCAVLQTGVAVGLTWIIGGMFGWSFETSLVLGFVLALSSTAV